MWQWQFIISIALTLNAPSSLASSPTTATSNTAEEAALLWKNGKEAFDKKAFFEAAQSFQKIVDHYPAHFNYLDSQLLLGKSYIELKKPDSAIIVLKNYIRSSSLTKQSDSYIQAKLWLGTAYIHKHLFNEAYLAALELEKFKLPPNFEIPRLLLKAQSLMGKEQDPYAERTLDSAKNLLYSEGTNSAHQAPYATVNLLLKLKHCSKFPSPGKLDESQMIDQLNRRGTCLLEAVLIYKEILNSQSEFHIEQAQGLIQNSFSDYLKKCNLPYNEHVLPQGKRTKPELEKHVTELSLKLKEDYSKKQTNALDLLVSWKSKFPAASILEASLKEVK